MKNKSSSIKSLNGETDPASNATVMNDYFTTIGELLANNIAI